jgi:translocator protein
MNRIPAVLIAATTVTAAQLIGSLRGPTPDHPATAKWYARLRKPSFTPPGPVFGVVWTSLDALLAFAGYKLLTAPPSLKRTSALGCLGLNLLGVAGFSWVMFGRKRLDQATEITFAMAATSVATVVTASEVNKSAAWATLPLAAWVIFASVLQEEVWRRNP